MNSELITEKKNKLRKKMRSALARLSQSESEHAGRMIWKAISTHIFPCLGSNSKKAWHVGIYYPIQGEPNFLEIYHAESVYGIQFLFPVVQGENLSYHRPRSMNDFIVGPLGVLQPRLDAVPSKPEDIDAILVPGLAFDRLRHRLGRGKGYYDRYLGQYSSDKRPLIVGVCHGFQLENEIACQPHDIAMDYIITPEMII